MATYALQNPPHAGAAITVQTPASGDLAPTGSGIALFVFNGSVSSITVTLPLAPAYDGLAVTSRTFVVAASTLAAPVPVLIPLPSSVYGTGTTVVNYSATATVSVAVITVPGT